MEIRWWRVKALAFYGKILKIFIIWESHPSRFVNRVANSARHMISVKGKSWLCAVWTAEGNQQTHPRWRLFISKSCSASTSKILHNFAKLKRAFFVGFRRGVFWSKMIHVARTGVMKKWELIPLAFLQPAEPNEQICTPFPYICLRSHGLISTDFCGHSLMRLGDYASPYSCRKHRITGEQFMEIYSLSSEEDSGFNDKLSEISLGMKQIK